MSVNKVIDSVSYVSYLGKTYILPTRYAPQDYLVQEFGVPARQVVAMGYAAYVIIDEATGNILKSRFFSPGSWRK